MFCPNCGSQISNNVKFCPNCGIKCNNPTTDLIPQQPISKSISKHTDTKKDTHYKRGRTVITLICTIIFSSAIILAALLITNKNKVNTIPLYEASDDVHTVTQSAESTSAPTAAPTTTPEPQPVSVPLTKLDAIKQGNYIFVGIDAASDNWDILSNQDSICKDVNGTTYSSSDIHYLSVPAILKVKEDIDYRSITYYLNQGYDTLSGTMYRPYITLTCNSEWEKGGTVEIYGDDILLYTYSMDQNVYDPAVFEIDISNVRELRITLKGMWSGEHIEERSMMPKICLTNLTVTDLP